MTTGKGEQMGIGLITSIEATVRQLGNNRWSQRVRSSTIKDFYKRLDILIEERERCPCCKRKLTSGSYQISVKINGGYAKDKETGTTIQINWRGELSEIREIVQTAFR